MDIINIYNMKKTVFYLGIFSLLIMFIACTGNQEKVVDEFVDAFNKEDESAMKDLFHSKIDDEMVDFAKVIKEEVGDIENHSKYAFNKSTNNGETVTQLYYECEVSETSKTVYFMFTLRDDDGTDKIASILYSTNKDYVDNYSDYKEDVLAIMEEYFDARAETDDQKTISLLDEEFTNNEEITELFLEYVEAKEEYYGKTEDHKFEFINSELVDGIPYFYAIYSCETDNRESIAEAYTLRMLDEEFKIYDYRYAESLDELFE